MGHLSPVLEKPVHLLTMKSVACVGLLSRLALVDSKVLAPGFPDNPLGKEITLLREETIQAAVLLFLHPSKLLLVFCLRLYRHIHLNKPVVASRRVLIVVELVLTHVATSHVTVL